MGLTFTPYEGVRSEPLKVEDPLDQGWTFHTVRSDALAFQPFTRPMSLLKIAGSAQASAARLKTLQDIAESEDEDRAAESVLLLDDETCAEIDEANARLAELRLSMPHKPEQVAALVTGWDGVKDEAADAPFSREALLSLLADDYEIEVANGDGTKKIPASEYRWPDGHYAGMTTGEALCRHIPTAVHEQTMLEELKLQEKKVSSAKPRSSGRGSGTSRGTRKTKRIASGKSKSTNAPPKP